MRYAKKSLSGGQGNERKWYLMTEELKILKEKLYDSNELLKKAYNALSKTSKGCSVNMDWGSPACGYCDDCYARNVLREISNFISG